MKIYYTVEEERIAGEDREHLAFGIAARREDGERIAGVSSLFFDRERAEQFAAVCNRLGLSPRHLDEVAEDILTEP